MKISEMTNDQAAVAMVRLSGPFARICEDDEMLALIDEIQTMRGGSKLPVVKAVGTLLPKFVTFGLAKHKDDLYEIVGALLMEPAGKVGSMNFVQTVNAVKESYDDVLVSFFTQYAQVTQNRDA